MPPVAVSRIARHGLAGVALVGLTLPVASCVQALGIEQLPPVDPRFAQCGAVRYADAACAACVDARCCDEADACAADTACAARIACLSRCSAADAGCRIRCGGPSTAPPDSPEGRFEACRMSRCYGECLGCGGLGDAWGADCSACVASQCCEAATACVTDPQCRAGAACVAGCTDPICFQRCVQAGTSKVWWAGASCVDACTACAFGQVWGCVGRYQIPNKTGDSSTFAVTIKASGGGLDGLQVKACALTDPDCAKDPPLAIGTTAGGGKITLQVPLGQAGFDGYLEVTDPMAAAPRILPNLVPVRTVLDSVTLTATVFSLGDIKAITSLMKVGFDPSKDAAVGMLVEDCLEGNAPGVKLSPQPPYASAPVVYFHDAFPDPSATSTPRSGLAAAVVEVSADNPFFTVAGSLAATGDPIGSATIPIRSGAVSGVVLLPAPK